MSRPPSARPARAVVTVSYGSEDVLGGFLDSVRAASKEPVVVVVADNKPTARTAALAEAASADYLELPANPGYGAAVNAAVAGLPPEVEWVLVSNPDVELSAGAFDRLMSTASSAADIGSVGPLILTPDGEVYPSARRIPSLRTGVGHAMFVGAWPRNPWTRNYRQDANVERRDAGWLSGSCVLLRRSAFEEIGGFDEGYFMYFEDVDLGYRLGRAGYRNVYEPAASATHSGGHATTREHGAMLRAHHTSAKRFISRRYPGWKWAPVRLALKAGLELRWLVTWLRSRRRVG